jgi:hypothetical protein
MTTKTSKGGKMHLLRNLTVKQLQAEADFIGVETNKAWKKAELVEFLMKENQKRGSVQPDRNRATGPNEY